MKRFAILMVGGDDTQPQNLKAFLRRRGFEILEFRDPRSALRAFQYGNPDLVMMGCSQNTAKEQLELAHQIRQLDKKIPLIMLTSGSYAGDVSRSRELGAEGYLIKPVRRNDLLQTIVQVLSTHPPASHPVSTWQESVRRLGTELHAQPSRRPHILIAEDNIINQKYALSVLQNEGYSAVVVGN